MNFMAERLEIGAEPRVLWPPSTAAQAVRNPDHGLNQTLSHCALTQHPIQTFFIRASAAFEMPRALLADTYSRTIMVDSPRR
jgi:hypothetical protein